MQKISSYLYPNRIEVIADVALDPSTCPVEWKIVYQKPIKIYKGVDNVIELEVKNADQKRIDIFGKSVKFVLMDQTSREIETYDATVVDDGSTVCIRGVARITLPEADLADLEPQHLKFTSYVLNNDNTKTLLYGDSKYGAQGFIDLLDGVIPTSRALRRFDTFQPETNYAGHTQAERTETYYSSAVPVKFYEAVPTTSATVTITLTDFVGSLGIQGTKKESIGHEGFLNPAFNSVNVFADGDISGTATRTFTIDTTDLTYLRVYYIETAGTVDFFTVAS